MYIRKFELQNMLKQLLLLLYFFLTSLNCFFFKFNYFWIYCARGSEKKNNHKSPVYSGYDDDDPTSGNYFKFPYRKQ